MGCFGLGLSLFGLIWVLGLVWFGLVGLFWISAGLVWVGLICIGFGGFLTNLQYQSGLLQLVIRACYSKCLCFMHHLECREFFMQMLPSL